MNEVRKTPLHLWIVGGLTALWNAFGATDYTMTQLRNDAYLAAFTPEQRAWFDSFPAWSEAFWALGVWGALAGSLLLLARSRHAVTAFTASLIGLAGSSLFQFAIASPNAIAMMGMAALYITIAVWAIAIALLLYARRQRAAGVLG